MPDETQPRLMLYGRRRGRPLRKQRSDLLESLLPRLAIRPDPRNPLDPKGLFLSPRAALWVEVGFGGGEHLAAQAAANPSVGLIGCEPFVNGVANLLQHLAAGSIENVRIVPDDARPLLDALPDASVDRAFVLFPDPWPKARHASRRFIGPDNLPRLARVLSDGAELRLATDDRQLSRWMLEHVWRSPAFEWLARGPGDWRSRPDDWPETRYERKALEAGRSPVFLRFRRRPR